jgi:hypothetical protein
MIISEIALHADLYLLSSRLEDANALKYPLEGEIHQFFER